MSKKIQAHVKSILDDHADQISKQTGVKISSSAAVEKAAKSIGSTSDSSSSDDIVDLQGWATVSAISLFHLNEAIIAQGESPKSYSQVVYDTPKKETQAAKATGDFGPWQIAATGDSGSTITFHIPLKNQTFQVGEPKSITYTFPDFSLLVELQAEFIETGFNKKEKKLLIKEQSDDDAISPATIINTKGLKKLVGPKIGPFGSGNYAETLDAWLNANLDKFKAVLSTVDFSVDYPDGTMDWIKPSATDYAVVAPSVGATLKNSRLGVMTLIDGEKIGAKEIASEIPLNVIPEDCDAVFAISQRKFIKHMLLPSVPKMFSDDPSSAPSATDFKYDKETYSIKNTNEVKMREVELDNGDKVSPKIKAKNFTIGVTGRFLNISFKTEPVAYNLITNVTINYSASYALAYDKHANKGKGGIGISSSDVSCSITPHTDGWFEDVEIILAVAGLAAAIVGGISALGAIADSAGAGVEGAIATSDAMETTTSVDSGAGGVEMEPSGGDEPRSGDDGGGSDKPSVKARSVTTPKKTPNAIEKPSLSMLKKGCLKIHQWGLPFKQVTYGCMGLGLAGGAFATVVAVKTEYDDENLSHMGTNFVDKATSAIQSTVAWPYAGKSFQIKSVQLNHALQFGFEVVPEKKSS